MQMITRRYGSQRTSAPIKITLEPNWGGQGDTPEIVFKDENGRYIMLVPETAEDVKALLSAAHHNF
jgi:hypothetical protein